MRVLCVDPYGESALDWLWRCVAAGHRVKWFIGDEKKRAVVGAGMVEKVADWREWMRWADLVFMPDNTKYLRDLDAWRGRGPVILGPSQEGAAWELDRNLGMSVFRRHGIPIPPYREFDNYDKAIQYVKREDRPFVSKPCGVETDKSLSYVANSPEDLIYMLERWKRAGKLKGSFILQEKVKGVEMGVGAWVGPAGFIAGWEENFEFKKLMAGDVGPATGEMGTTMRYVRRSKLADKVLRPFEDELVRMGYLGCVDVNCIVDRDGTPWPLEWTMRPGWPAFNIQQALQEGDPAEWLMDLAEGRDPEVWVYDKIAVGVVMAIGDFPHSHATQKEVVGVPLYGVPDAPAPDIHLCQAMVGEAPTRVGDKIVVAPHLVTAGDYVLVATGTGDTVSAASRAAYRALGKIEPPTSPIYRNDIGYRLARQLPKVQEFGYADGLRYA